ncbi:endonuclease/exonuclease/phosphatase family protein [Sulfurimonas sp. HSL3-7]|uniref:endonuclease/exonuclease/phosphatase family protein n=1 Tax=Sulfonitrofixus jiaomeiensis TaxID=3131938 RepID=UPI0031F9CA2D
MHKENLQPQFQHAFKAILHDYPSDFLLFQEAKFPKKMASILDDFSYAMASNIETFQHLYGVLTATQVAFKKIRQNLSHRREVGMITHKSMLITHHQLPNGQNLHVVNIHAINFVSIKIFTKELEKIKTELHSCSGPMIVGGDFNNWTKKRMKALEAFQQALGLEKAEVHQEHHIKQIFAKPLDHIFYKDLKLLKAEAIDTKNVSDHNPIYATFSVKS